MVVVQTAALSFVLILSIAVKDQTYNSHSWFWIQITIVIFIANVSYMHIWKDEGLGNQKMS